MARYHCSTVACDTHLEIKIDMLFFYVAKWTIFLKHKDKFLFWRERLDEDTSKGRCIDTINILWLAGCVMPVQPTIFL
jgi:hypothetical protein